MMKEVKLIKRKVTRFGNSCHILIPKKYENRNAYVVLFENSRGIRIHKKSKQIIDNITYYKGELSDGAGTHSNFLIKENDAKDLGLL